MGCLEMVALSMNNFNMKRFLFKISFYIVAVVAVLLFLGTYADGNTDDNYRHFIGPEPSNIILGDSRGAQAMVPFVLNEKIKGRTFNNFALNIGDSPYGQVYFEALKKKINPDTKDGIFILTVDPWCLSLDKSLEHSKDDPDKNSTMADMHFFNMTPNYEYLLKHYPRSWFNIYKEREEIGKSATYLHKDGWMEVSVDVHPDSVSARAVKKIEGYTNLLQTQKISQFRLNGFVDMIKYLRDKGSVYIVRIPAFKGMMELEDRYDPNFSQRIENIAKENGVKFFDLSSNPENYTYTDGNHMYKESGKIFTAQIADSILLDRKNLK